MATSDDTSGSAIAWNQVKQWIQGIGVLGVGGGGITAVALGIGFLAHKSQEKMLGIYTATANTATYMRTGALFLPNSFGRVADALASSLEIRLALITLLVLLVILTWRAAWLEKWGHQFQQSVAAYTVSLMLLLSIVLVYLPYHVAPLHPINTNLILDERSSSPGPSFALMIRDALRDPVKSTVLNNFYGFQFAVVLGISYCAVLLQRWRRSIEMGVPISDEAKKSRTMFIKSGGLSVADWIVKPLLYLVLLALIFTIPANYGVMALPLDRPCVIVSSQEDVPEYVGFLMSELSTEADQLVVLESGGPNHFRLRFHNRQDVKEITYAHCGVRNPLHFQHRFKQADSVS